MSWGTGHHKTTSSKEQPMELRPEIEGCEGQDIVVKTSLLGGSSLLVNGQKAPKGPGLRTMSLTRNDGRVVTAQWKQQMLGFDTPQLVVDGKTYILAEPLKWYAVGLSALPLALVFIGGLLGAIIGLLAFASNASIFRSNMHIALKILLALVIIVVAVVLYMIAATLVTAALGR
jgi:hypothetical protein